MSFGQFIPELLVDLFTGFCGINSEAIAAIAEGGHYWQCLVLESSDALGDSIGLVVRTTAGLAALGHAGCHGLGGTVEVDQVPNHHLIRQPLLKLLPILPIPREAIEEVPPVSSLGDSGL